MCGNTPRIPMNFLLGNYELRLFPMNCTASTIPTSAVSAHGAPRGAGATGPQSGDAAHCARPAAACAKTR